MLFFPLLLATLTTTAEINTLPRAEFDRAHAFALTGTVSAALFGDHYILEDATGRTHIRNESGVFADVGDRIAFSGYTSVDGFRQEQCNAKTAAVLEHGPRPENIPETVRRISEGACDYENVVVEGLVTDVFRDDIDPNWNYLILEDDGVCVYVTVPNVSVNTTPERFSRRRVRVTGTVIPNHTGARRFIGPHVETTGFKSLELLPAETDDATAPTFDASENLPPTAIIHSNQHTLEGLVCCVWRQRSLLLRGNDGEVHRVDLADNVPPPPVGTRVTAVGQPETDLFRINLSKASCTTRADAATPLPAAAPRPTDTFALPRWMHWQFHGRFASFTGTVIDEPTADSEYRALLGENGQRMLFDVSAVPELAARLTAGSRVRATGCGLVEMENWRPGAALPPVQGLVIVARTLDDLVILSTPPWWTTGKLFAVILSLFAVLIAILVWNRLLNRMVERRGRQLLRETYAHAEAELRTDERTRLAVELHDSISQTLTGIACQIESADRARVKDPARIEGYLDLARRTLDSCRADLRNCIWDLRNRTLEDADAETAIRRTVQPHAGKAELAIAFAVGRNQMSDNTFHDILCILRELVANAVRHGQARRISIVGRREDDTLELTVTDDGRGFDPETRPGSAEGHFGLLGVTERLDRLNGSLQIESAPGRGATFRIRLRKGS